MRLISLIEFYVATIREPAFPARVESHIIRRLGLQILELHLSRIPSMHRPA